MQTHPHVPAPQRIWDIGDPGSDEHLDRRGSAAGRLTAVAALLFAASSAISGRLFDVTGGGADIAAFVIRTVAVVAATAALAGGFVVLAGAGRHVRRRAMRGRASSCSVENRYPEPVGRLSS